MKNWTKSSSQEKRRRARRSVVLAMTLGLLLSGLKFSAPQVADAQPEPPEEQTDDEATASSEKAITEDEETQSAPPDESTVDTTTPDEVESPDTTPATTPAEDDPPASTPPPATTAPATTEPTVPATTVDEPTATTAEPTTTTANAPETTDVPDTTTAPTPAAEPEPSDSDELQISPLSVSEPGTYARSDPGGSVTFYAYVEAGETLDVTAIRNAAGGNATNLTVTIEGPGGVSVTCTAATTCTRPGLSSTESGIWRIVLRSNVSTGATGYAWEIDVNGAGGTADGRVWAELYPVIQCIAGGTDADLEFWYQSELGFTYEAAYGGFNGCFSSFSADATGIRDDGTCTSAYVSIEQSDPNRSATSPGECGDPYKIFFERPAAELPASAVRWDGATDWIASEPVLPDIASPNYTPDGPTGRSGTIDYQINNFTGQVVVEIDTDNDGTFDLAIPGSAVDGVGSVSFDGLDGDGNPVSMFHDLPIRLSVAQAGEIHFMNLDVEIRAGGIEVTKLNGPQAGDTTVYWDDTELSTTGRCPTSALDGTAGVPSGGGVHGWPTCTPAAGTWGNLRIIDDWTYHSIDEFEEIVIPAETQPPFECGSNAAGLLFQSPGGPGPTFVNFVDMVTGDYETPITVDDMYINGAGYNVLDGYVYGQDRTNLQLVRIGSDGSVEPLELPAGLPATATFNMGEVDENGHYWVAAAGAGAAWYQIDLNVDPAVVIDSGTMAGGGVENFGGGVDWSYVPGGGDYLYRVMSNQAGTNSVLYRFNRATGSHEQVGSLGNLGDNVFGATYADAGGFLYASSNGTGEIFRIDAQAATATKFADGPPTAGNDGARCFESSILIDFGDAPDSYGAELVSDGPRHGIPDYDEQTGEASLMLGGSIDPEIDGFPGPDADGDDADNLGDEDGVGAPIVMVIGQDTVVDVTVTNMTGEPATLAGRIDLNDDGVFDDGERQFVVVPPGGTTTETLTFPAVGSPGDGTFARFRLFPGEFDDPADILPTGPAAAGEVEDYPVVGPIPVQIDCPSVYAAQGSSPHNFYEVDTTTGDMTSAGSLDLGQGTNNALGFSSDGRYLFSYLSGSPGSVIRYDTFTGATDDWAGSINSATHGAVDPATGIYYYGTVGTGSGSVYAFDTNTETNLGRVATINWDTPAAGGNGDWAFDSLGNLYVVAGQAPDNPLYVVSDPLPTTAQPSPVAVTGNRLTMIAGGSDAINGIAFDGDGYLYLASNQNIYQVHPSSGQVVDTETLSPSAESVDLGSCATPATIQVQKDIVERATDGDQFEVTVTGGGISQNNVGTTTGTDTGVQDESGEVAGPVLGFPGETYDIAEAGVSGADLANYQISWECVNTADNDTVVDNGTGDAGSFTMPDPIGGTGANIVCTFTNSPVVTELDKELVGEIVGNGDGTWTATYELSVTRTGDGPAYDLLDTLQYGDAVTIEGQPTAVNTQPGGIATNPNFDGEGVPLVAGGIDIADGETHLYEVSVDFSIDTEQVTFENSDCTLGDNESGTGLYNEASVEVNDTTITDNECPILPPEPLVDKTVTSGPDPVGNGEYEITYEITATNPFAGDGLYTIDDELLYGDGITVANAQVANIDPGGIATNPNWDGEGTIRVVTDEPIGAATAAGPEVHTYEVTVVAEVAPGIDPAEADCDPQTGGPGTGFLNRATLTVNGETNEAEDCVVPPVTDFDKELVDRISNGDGTYTLVYEMIVTRTGDGPGYNLDDTLTYGDAVTVDDVQVTSAPAAATLEPSFDGQANTRVASNVPIDDGGTHSYTIEIDVTVDGESVTFENSNCDDEQGESGTGFSNEAAVTVNDVEITDQVCEGFPFTDVDKQTTSDPAPLPNGNYRIEYTITATNTGAAPDTYDLTDALQYGAGITVVDAQVANTQPGTITTRPEWDGETDTLVVDDEQIAAATDQGPAVHEYVVTVEVDVPPDIDPDDADCDPQTGGPGTGFLNEAMVNGESGPSADTNCPPVPQTDFDKDLVSKTSNGDGTYTLSYELTVTREGTDGTYDLNDELLLSDAVNVVGGPSITAPAGVDPADLNAGFNGDSDTLVIGGQDIAAGATHVYTMDVVVEVDLEAVTPENSDCNLTQGEAGTGAMNRATLEIDNQTYEGDTCEEFPGTTVDKQVASGPDPLGNGEYEVTYEITVMNSGAGDDTYDVEDEFHFGGSVSIVNATVVNTQPGTITTESTWDGVDNTMVVEDEFIAGATTGNPTIHIYEVTVVVEAPPDIAATEADCIEEGGEDGTGLLNEVTVTGESGESTDDACPELPSTDFDKNVVGDDPVGNGDGTYTITYELLVSRTGDGPGYNLVDALRYGDAVNIESQPQVTAPPAVDPGLLNGNYDGEGDTLVASNVPIGDGETHRYEVAVTFSIETELVTYENTDCTIGINESGTGLLNDASAEVNDTAIEDRECPIVPPEPVVDKTITSDPPTPIGNGRYEITYEITATNDGAGNGTYTVDDELLYGDGITVVSAQVVNTQPGGIITNPNWNGEGRIRVVTNEPIDGATAAGPEVHTYEVTVVAEVDPGIDLAEADCDPQTGGPGTGFLNRATLEVNGKTNEAEDCVEAPVTEFDKELVDVTPNGDGDYTLTYELTVTRTGDGPGYDLDDTLHYGDAVTVDSVTATNTQPGGIATNGNFDGENDVRVASGVPIADGDTHTYEVIVDATVAGDQVTFENSDCDLESGQSDTGFSNTAGVTSNGSTVTDKDCDPLPGVTVDKTTTSGPTPLGGGEFEIVYEITATNAGAGDGAYNIDDELLYGSGVTVVSAQVANTQPGGIATNPNWNGEGNIDVVTGEPIAGAADAATPTVHTYEVTVVAEVAGNITPEDSDCALEPGDPGTGFLNRATMTGDSSNDEADACPPVPITEIDKELADINHLEGRRFELLYDLTVERIQGGDGTYTLRDELLLGDSLTIDNVTATNTDPGNISTNPDYDGVDDIEVAGNQPIRDGEIHLYQVRVEVTVDIGAATPGNADCDLGPGEGGTGTMNRATLTVDGVEPNPVEDCKSFPATTHFKDVVDGPTPVGDGDYEISYEMTVINAGAGDDEYDLDDTLLFGDGITIQSASVSNATPGNIATNPNWDGVDEVMIVEDEPIAGGTDQGPEIHTYRVDVVANAPAGIDPDTADCTVGPGEPGSGLANTSTLTVGPDTETDDACEEIPVTDIDKELVDVVDNGDGTSTLDYDITVTRTGDGGPYRLVDHLQYGNAVTVDSVTATNTQPGGVSINPDFDGVEVPLIAGGVPIADSETHLYEVTVVASVDADSVTFENSDCQLADGEDGTGFYNEASVTSNGTTVSDDDCDPTRGGVGHAKEVSAGPTHLQANRYEVEYTVTVVNHAAGNDHYTLDDQFSFGDGVSIVSADVNNATPGGIATNPNWNGQDRMRVVTDQPIAGAQPGSPTTHTYTITVVVEAAGDITEGAANCTLGDGEPGTGFLNFATMTVNGTPETDDACTEVPAGELLDITKVAGTTAANHGDTVAYTITVKNAGAVDFTNANPAEVVDDLTDVLDDATWLGDAAASAGSVSYNDPQLTWNGPLAIGDTVTIAYSVEVNDTATGSGDLHNVVSSNTGDSNCPAGSSDPDCNTNTPITDPNDPNDPTDPPAPTTPPSPITPGPLPVTG